MSETTFTLRYDGPALVDNTMDVADLAPALVALSQYMKSSSRVVNGDKLEIGVRVKAVETGSFQIVLQVTGTFLDHVVDILSSKPSTAIANLVGYATAAVSLIAAIRGRKVDHLRPSALGRIVMVLDDGEPIEVEEAVARIATDLPARAALERVIADPLDRDGVDEVRFGPSSAPVIITQDQADSFRAAIGSADQLLETISRMVFSLVSVSFQPGNKWRVSTGRGPPISVTVADEVFILSVQTGREAFAKGDFLICDVRTTARETSGRLAVDYVIVKVIEHRRASPAQEPML